MASRNMNSACLMKSVKGADLLREALLDLFKVPISGNPKKIPSIEDLKHQSDGPLEGAGFLISSPSKHLLTEVLDQHSP